MNLTEGQLLTIEALNRIEGFEWPECSEFAGLGCNTAYMAFWASVPIAGDKNFRAFLDEVYVGTEHPDWRNSLITREQFDSVDGWVRNDGNKPVISGDFDLLLADGEALYFCDIRVDRWDWSVPCKGGVEITHWRHNKPTKETGMQQEAPNQPSIDELYSQYKEHRKITASAKELLAESMEKEDKLLEQIKAWNLEYGFDIRVLNESDEVPEDEPNHEPELVITDWRDLQVGDVVRCWGKDYEMFVVDVYLDSNCDEAVFLARTKNGSRYTVHDGDWKFIRRPSN